MIKISNLLDVTQAAETLHKIALKLMTSLSTCFYFLNVTTTVCLHKCRGLRTADVLGSPYNGRV